MLKETESEETINILFCHIFIIGGTSIGGTRPPCPPPGYAYAVDS